MTPGLTSAPGVMAGLVPAIHVFPAARAAARLARLGEQA